MSIRKYHLILAITLVIAVCASFLGVRSVHADEGTPTEPPAPTQVATESPTEPPAESTPEPVEAAATPLAEVIDQVPEDTEVVVLDEDGDSVPLASQEAAEIAEVSDPMWCPEGVLPGDAGCSASYPTISALINNMVSNTPFYTQNGVIYFTADPGTGTFNLSPTTLTSDFDTLKNYNLTLQGGWNGSTATPSLSGQTDFANRPITIGSSGNPWAGNITLNDITFTGASQTSLTVYTTTGDITLSNVDVNNQAGGHNTALLDTASGDITVSNGTFDGNNTNSAGFFAATGSGSITISDSSFTQNKKSGSANNSDGATLSAPIVTLTNVTATNNDGDGITIMSADLVTLNNVVASNNGTNPPGPVSNDGSGVFFSGNLGSSLLVNGGTFSGNKEYGIELADPANTTIMIQSAPTCTGNLSGCSNGTFISDTIPPSLSLPPDISIPAAGPAGAVVNYSASATDNLDPAVSVTCLPPSGSTFAVGSTTVNCFASDAAGNTALGSFQVTVLDMTVPVLPTPPASASTGSASGSSNSGQGSSALIIPVTGGKVIDLDCNSTFWAFGIKLSFMSLCDYQTMLDNVDANNLPGALPNGYSFVMGLDLGILSEGKLIEDLPNGTSIQLDFPILGGPKAQFAVLHWDGNQWIEISQQSSDNQDFYQIVTMDKTGIFILVKK